MLTKKYSGLVNILCPSRFYKKTSGPPPPKKTLHQTCGDHQKDTGLRAHYGSRSTMGQVSDLHGYTATYILIEFSKS